MVLTNELPKLGDSSGALTGRLIILKFTESFYGREDTTLTAKLIPELPGILLWAIAGWKRLHDRGSFSQPESGEELAEVMGELSSPISTFIRDCCIDSPNATCPKADLFTVWKAWCEIYGRDHPGDHATFGRNLRAARSKIRNAQPRVPDRLRPQDDRVESYAGIGMNEASRSSLAAYKSSEESGQQIRLTSILKAMDRSSGHRAANGPIQIPLPVIFDEKTQERISWMRSTKMTILAHTQPIHIHDTHINEISSTGSGMAVASWQWQTDMPTYLLAQRLTSIGSGGRGYFNPLNNNIYIMVHMMRIRSRKSYGG